jgi:hypothetical protein
VNYIAKDRHITHLPGSFFVVWSKQDNDIMDDPELSERLKLARARTVAAWALTKPADDMSSVTEIEYPPEVVGALANANAEMHAVYIRAGVSPEQAKQRMSVNQDLLVNAINNASFRHAPNTSVAVAEPAHHGWRARASALLSTLSYTR